MDAYRHAGVDLDAAARAVRLIRDLASSAGRPEVVGGVGGFAGLFRMGYGKLLAAATDGVGTKTEVAREAGRLDTVGIDLVAMCADDVVCTGAEPLFFLDYLAVGRLVPEDVAALVSGIAEGCRRAGCALLGGETAEHPGTLEEGRFDLAGFCVGVVEEDRLLGPARVEVGDVLVGLPASGLHANGFSLVRRLLAEAGIGLDDRPEELGRSVADELLEPTAIYAPAVLAAARADTLHAAAHVTGGGIPENLARVLPQGLGAEVERSSWERPAVFGWLGGLVHLSDEDLLSTFNMGLGMVLVVPEGRVAEAEDVLARWDQRPVRVGRVVKGDGVRLA